MQQIISQLCALRGYTEDLDEVRTPAGAKVLFYYTPIFDYDFFGKVYPPADANSHIIVFYDKQKKKPNVPLETIKNFEILKQQMIQLVLIPNKFRPAHTRLSGEELEQMSKHADKLPILLLTDPMAIAHGLGSGDIVKISRLNGLPYYRRVE